MSPHVCRHSVAVWLAEAGTPMHEIAQMLGHTDTATTYRVYARYSPDHLRGAADALEIGACSSERLIPLVLANQYVGISVAR